VAARKQKQKRMSAQVVEDEDYYLLEVPRQGRQPGGLTGDAVVGPQREHGVWRASAASGAQPLGDLQGVEPGLLGHLGLPDQAGLLLFAGKEVSVAHGLSVTRPSAAYPALHRAVTLHGA
jgi:hypothetical protein